MSPATDGVDPRLHVLNDRDARPGAAYVLYWCRAYRRPFDNLALDHGVRRANALGLPLVVYESLDVRQPHACDRFHTFVLEGVAEMASAVESRGARYVFFLPRTAHEAQTSRAVERLAERAAAIVTDWMPPVGGARSLWARTGDLARRMPCRFECYDDSAVVPIGPLATMESSARAIRPKILAQLDANLLPPADARVHAGRLAELDVSFSVTDVRTEEISALVARCEIDHDIAPVAGTHGGRARGEQRLRAFVDRRLRHYADERNDLARMATSGLSPYLHFGHVSARAVALAAKDADVPAEARDTFIEQVVVRRALAFHYACSVANHAEYDAVPAWARATLAMHARDPRSNLCSFEDFAAARTPDPLWNAAQRELLSTGVIHPYARMLWGKLALTMTVRPEVAFEWLLRLDDTYALDGRDPNTHANIAWCFGQHDRAFPERPVFGKVRSMTSAAVRRKFDADAYMARFGIVASSEPRATVRRGNAHDEFDQRTPWDET